MSYSRHVWTVGDKPTAALLNNIESGVTETDAQASSNAEGLATNTTTLTQGESDLSAAQTAALELRDDAAAAITQIESSQNVCFARASATGSSTALTGYAITYQPYDNLFAVSSTSGLTCQKAGTYFLMCDAFLTNTDATLKWYKNAVEIGEIARVYTNKSTPIGQRVMGFSFATLAVGDVITFGVARTSATTDTCYDLNAHLYKVA